MAQMTKRFQTGPEIMQHYVPGYPSRDTAGEDAEPVVRLSESLAQSLLQHLKQQLNAHARQVSSAHQG